MKKNSDMTWLKEVDSVALQASMEDLDKAFQNFFRGIKNNKKVGYPKFKCKHNRKQSYRTRGQIHVSDKQIKLPKLGWIKAKVSTQIKGRILNATVSFTRTGKFFVSICCTDVECNKIPFTGEEIGIDLGLKYLITMSNGQQIDNKKYLNNELKKLQKIHRSLSRKTKGSSRYEKERLRLAKQYELVLNKRNDYLHKITTDIVQKYDVIYLEDLSIANMVKNHNFSRSILDAAWGDLCKKLLYKAKWNNKKVVKINRFFPSSQICSSCGYINKDVKDLHIRNWSCPICGVSHDRDVNAAKNILQEGKKFLKNI